jgi:hypothetical protein
MLRRRILRNSVPPEILNEAARRAWAKSTEQWMGVYCTLDCLEKSLARLKTLDQIFRERGVGTRRREPEANLVPPEPEVPPLVEI